MDTESAEINEIFDIYLVTFEEFTVLWLLGADLFEQLTSVVQGSVRVV